MRALLLLALLSTSAVADEYSELLDQICRQGFKKTSMPAAEANRFCSCVIEDVQPRLNAIQRTVLRDTKSAIANKTSPPTERMASSGLRDLVVSGQARCEAAFYPPSAPINIVSGQLHLTLRCEDESKKPEAFIYRRGMELLSKADMKALDARLMKDDATPEYAIVDIRIDSDTIRKEKWEIDMTGEIVSSPNSATLIDRLRTANSMDVSIKRGSKKYSAAFVITGKIPARWAPCGGVSR